MCGCVGVHAWVCGCVETENYSSTYHTGANIYTHSDLDRGRSLLTGLRLKPTHCPEVWSGALPTEPRVHVYTSM